MWLLLLIFLVVFGLVFAGIFHSYSIRDQEWQEWLDEWRRDGDRP